MKKVILILLLVILFSSEIIFLFFDGKKLNTSNIKLQEEISNYNYSSEKGLKKDKELLEEEVGKILSKATFNEYDAKEVIEKEEDINTSLNSEISVLENSIELLEGDLTKLQSEYNTLVKNKKEESSYFITNVPTINQYPDYPTGCESIAITIILNYYGIIVNPDDIIKKIKKGDIPYIEDDKKYGGNPELEFVGDPKNTNSYGVYEKPIAEVANTYKDGIIIATGTSFNEILKIVKGGRPVMVWTSMNLDKPYISKSWIYKPTGETIYWKANEHAVVIVGYTSDKIIISDPIGGKIKYQSKTLFEERYNYYGKKALYY